jgi:hypothetical protein
MLLQHRSKNLNNNSQICSRIANQLYQAIMQVLFNSNRSIQQLQYLRLKFSKCVDNAAQLASHYARNRNGKGCILCKYSSISYWQHIARARGYCLRRGGGSSLEAWSNNAKSNTRIEQHHK